MSTRRRLLQGLAALLSGCGVEGDWIYPDSGPSGPTPGTAGGTVPLTTPYMPGATGWTLLTFDQYPQLLENDGFIHVTVEGVRLIVTAGSDPDSWVAMDRICTHQSCDIVINFGRIACPCHGSIWDDKGKLIGGPARNQPVFPAYGAATGVWVKVDPA